MQIVLAVSKITLFSLVLLISLLSISSQNADAFIGYEYALKSQSDNPFYCVMENPVYKNYYWYIQQGVKDWERELHAKVSTPAQRALWDMSIVFVDKEYDSCDVMVYLDTYDNAPTLPDGNKPLGIANSYRIILYIINEQEGESVRQVMSHEVGHTLGLGHYVSDDEKIMIRWGQISHAPSIMIPTQYWNEKLQGITDNDINKIREIYGDGFYKPPPPPKYEPPVEKPPIKELQINPNEFPVKEIVVTRGQYILERLGGSVSPQMSKGEEVEVLKVNPDDTRDVGKIRIKNNYYEYPIMFDYTSLRGTYYVVVNYKDQEISKQAYFVTDTPTSQTPQSEPEQSVSQVSKNSVKVENTDYTLTPTITGGKILGITSDYEAKSLLIEIQTTSNGVLTITLPRDLIDAKINGEDDSFFVLADGEDNKKIVEKHDEIVRTLTIQFEDGNEEIEIIGTKVVPEFGSLAIMIIIISIIGVITIHRKFL